MLFVNRDYRNPVDTTMKMETGGKPLTKLDRASAKWVDVEGNPVRLQLPPGDAELYRW